jgi:actin-related protein
MLDLVAAVESEFQERVRHNIILAGGSSVIPGFGDQLKAAMTEYGGGEVQVVQDPVFSGSDGGLALAGDAPASDWEMLTV